MNRSFDAATLRERSRLCIPPVQGKYRYIRPLWRFLCAWIDAVGTALFSVIRQKPPACRPIREPHRVLVVQLDHLGDAVLSLGFLEALRQTYPGAQIDVLCGSWSAGLFRACPAVDCVLESRINRFAPTLRWCWPASVLLWGLRLRKRLYDLAFDVRGELPAALLLWLSGARRRVGGSMGGGGFLLTDLAEWMPGAHQLDHRRALLRAVGVPAHRAEGIDPAWTPAADDLQVISARLGGLTDDGLMVVAHVGAGTPAKRWSPGHWRELLGRLLLARPLSIVLVGSTEDRRTAQRILEGRAWPRVTDWTGSLTLGQLAALVGKADLFIGGDSGPAHLAAAVGTARVVLFSGTNRMEEWRPAGDTTCIRHSVPCSPCHRTHCPWLEHPCMTRIDPAHVADVVLQGLDSAARRRPGRATGRPAETRADRPVQETSP
jgi:ADP-heptose:LPS heptosyltransferase